MKTPYFLRNLSDFSPNYGIFLGFREKKTYNFVRWTLSVVFSTYLRSQSPKAFSAIVLEEKENKFITRVLLQMKGTPGESTS